MSEQVRCATCRFLEMGSHKQMVCVRYPQHLIGVMQQQSRLALTPNQAQPTQGMIMYGFPPITNATEMWCGEHQKKE